MNRLTSVNVQNDDEVDHSFLHCVIDDVWIEIFCACDVATFTSIRLTCSDFNRMTTTDSYRIQLYWKYTSKLLCNDIDTNYSPTKYRKWYTLSKQLFFLFQKFYNKQILTDYYNHRIFKSTTLCDNNFRSFNNEFTNFRTVYQTPLMMASSINATLIIDMILFSLRMKNNNNVKYFYENINKKTWKYRESALMFACKNNCYESTLLLLRLPNIDISTINHKSQTAFEISCKCGFIDIVKLF